MLDSTRIDTTMRVERLLSFVVDRRPDHDVRAVLAEEQDLTDRIIRDIVGLLYVWQRLIVVVRFVRVLLVIHDKNRLYFEVHHIAGRRRTAEELFPNDPFEELAVTLEPVWCNVEGATRREGGGEGMLGTLAN